MTIIWHAQYKQGDVGQGEYGEGQVHHDMDLNILYMQVWLKFDMQAHFNPTKINMKKQIGVISSHFH